MNTNTINDAVTIGGAQTALLANRYRIVRKLGQGGMGSVWLAEDTQLDGKQFAIKMLPSILVANKRAYNQLKAEALVSMKLTHPNIVTLRAFEENSGNPFLVMDYIDGQTLDDYLAEKGTLTADETIELLKPVASALDYAHGEGVVHRDVKPANVMIRKDGHPFVLDFGIAREIQETMTRVTGKLSSGTLLYMSPEQLNGASPKKEQDIYSFAAMAYECLKGNPPFHRGQIEHQILNNLPEPLDRGEVSVLSSVVGGVIAGLAKKPEDRPKTCVSVLTAGNFNAEKQSFGDAETVGNAVRVKRAVPVRRNVIPLSKQVPVKRNVVPVSKQEQAIGFLKVLAGLLFLCVLGGVIWLAIRDGDRGLVVRPPVTNDIVSQPTVVNVNVPQPIVTNTNSVKLPPVQPIGTTEADVTEIAVEAKVQKGRIERINDADGFKTRKDALSDLLVQAVAYGRAKRWDKAAVSFTNYVEGCKALLALDVKRQADKERRDSERREKERKDAEDARSTALAASKRAEDAGAKKYAADSWNDAIAKWKIADVSFNELRFSDAKVRFFALKNMFDLCFKETEIAKRAESERRAVEDARRLENERRLQQQLEERRRQMQSLPGKWTCTTKGTSIASGTTSSSTLRHNYSFRQNGTYTYELSAYADGYEQYGSVTSYNGKWSLSGTTLTLWPSGVCRTRMYTGVVSTTKISNDPEKYNILWHDDDAFELRYDINSLGSVNNRPGISNGRSWYDSSGTYHFEADVKSGWSSYHVVNTETPRILRRSR